MKKNILAVLSALMVVLLLAGCQTAGTESEGFIRNAIVNIDEAPSFIDIDKAGDGSVAVLVQGETKRDESSHRALYLIYAGADGKTAVYDGEVNIDLNTAIFGSKNVESEIALNEKGEYGFLISIDGKEFTFTIDAMSERTFLGNAKRGAKLIVEKDLNYLVTAEEVYELDSTDTLSFTLDGKAVSRLDGNFLVFDIEGSEYRVSVK